MSNRPSATTDNYSHLDAVPTPTLARGAKFLESKKFTGLGSDRHYFKKVKRALKPRGEKQLDTESDLTVIESVSEVETGYSMTYDSGWSFYLPKKYGIEPKVGDKVASYGGGFGHIVRGLEINGQEAYYRTAEEQGVINQQTRAEIEARMASDEAKHQETVGERIEAMAADPFEFSDEGQEKWNTSVEKNKDIYGFGVMEYAYRWAKLMDKALAEGEALHEIFSSLSDEADIDGITGFMYGAAVATLAETWQRGEQLMRLQKLKDAVGGSRPMANY